MLVGVGSYVRVDWQGRMQLNEGIRQGGELGERGEGHYLLGHQEVLCVLHGLVNDRVAD